MKSTNLFHLILSAFILSIAVACSVNDDDIYIKQSELPDGAKFFLNQYLPDNKFISARKYEIADSNERYVYEVNLKGDILVSFQGNGSWNYIEGEKGLPETVKPLLSQESQAQMTEKYPGIKMVIISNYGNDEKFILLDNGTRLYDIQAYEGYTLAEQIKEENWNSLPRNMRNFIEQHITSEQNLHDVIMFSGFKGAIYRYSLAGRATLDFYENGEWFDMKDTGSYGIINSHLIKTIPEEIISTLTEVHPNTNAIVEITRFNDNELYCFKMKDKQSIIISSENKVVDPPLDRIKEYINTGFDLDKEPNYKVNINTGTAYFLRYGFIITNDNNNEITTIVSNVKGDALSIYSYDKIEGVERNIAIPNAILGMYPSNITSYLNDNYPEVPILGIRQNINPDDTIKEISITLFTSKYKVLCFTTEGQFIKEFNTIGD